MKKVFLLLILSSFLLNGCIDIVEEITVNPDLSGTVSFTLDLGSLGGFAMNMGGKYAQNSMLDQIKNFPQTTAAILKGVNGLSNIKPISKSGLYSVSFDFKDPKQLNQAIYKLFDVKKKFFEPNYIRISKRKLVKKNYAPILRLLVKKYEDQLKDKSVLKYLSYKSEFHLPAEVRHFSNKKSTLSTDKKTLEFECTLEELLSSGVNIGNKIKY
jgi:hypothetical protein